MLELPELPKRLTSPIKITTPNQPVPIHNGTFKLSKDSVELIIEGAIEFVWLPKPEIRFSGRIIDGANLSTWYDLVEFEIWIDGFHFGDGGFTFRDLTEGIVKGSCMKGVIGKREESGPTIQFAIPNLREFWGWPVGERTPEKISTENARFQVIDDIFEVTVDKIKDHKHYRELLADQGGYMLLYAGEIIKKDGSDISWDEWQQFLLRFNFFLHFINGARTAPLFATVISSNSMVWRDYTPYAVDSHNSVRSWSNIHDRYLLTNIWKTWATLWADSNDRNFLLTAVHWYVEANTQGYVECAIVLAQNSLELIFNWLIVERKQIITPQEAWRKSAAEKIRLLLVELTVSPSMPASFRALPTMEPGADAPAAFVLIRNALVHGNENKRQRLTSITLSMHYEALQLAIWYIELALLYILEYQGKYKNRVDGNPWAGSGEKVPWATQRQNNTGS